ncbi:hypothetical protein RFI_16915 [Reticulomyxa filosa]|uniref:Uncharacterized protein n=1 Tax=Reticulomyxa filosa TaxID=46433 RepID=X6N2J1_RETFI|nr:hypothetical protein RFI_16915 [Reticulomyxa filosa]|eukprot:ETO20301.1 hypothetical protein RFI_16915 [Reticulomyxa filosa]
MLCEFNRSNFNVSQQQRKELITLFNSTNTAFHLFKTGQFDSVAFWQSDPQLEYNVASLLMQKVTADDTNGIEKLQLLVRVLQHLEKTKHVKLNFSYQFNEKEQCLCLFPIKTAKTEKSQLPAQEHEHDGDHVPTSGANHTFEFVFIFGVWKCKDTQGVCLAQRKGNTLDAIQNLQQLFELHYDVLIHNLSSDQDNPDSRDSHLLVWANDASNVMNFNAMLKRIKMESINVPVSLTTLYGQKELRHKLSQWKTQYQLLELFRSNHRTGSLIRYWIAIDNLTGNSSAIRDIQHDIQMQIKVILFCAYTFTYIYIYIYMYICIYICIFIYLPCICDCES